MPFSVLLKRWTTHYHDIAILVRKRRYIHSVRDPDTFGKIRPSMPSPDYWLLGAPFEEARDTIRILWGIPVSSKELANGNSSPHISRFATVVHFGKYIWYSTIGILLRSTSSTREQKLNHLYCADERCKM
jgi:hypothetical protein